MIRAVDVGCFDDYSSAVAHFANDFAPMSRKHFRGARLIELSFDVSRARNLKITDLKCLIDKSLFFDRLKIKANQSYRSRRQLEQLRC